MRISLPLIALLLSFWSASFASSIVQVRTQRWLEVRQVIGQVLFQQGQRSQPAHSGMRLQSVGDGIVTGSRSQSVLAADDGIGFIDVAEDTSVRVQQLQRLPDGGHVTRLFVERGQVSLRIRRFTHRSSELEIQTPAGWSGVRGTEFGLTVQPDGKTGVATRSGAVVARAQGRSVSLRGGFQSLIIPGEPPTPPRPLTTDARLQLNYLAAVDRQTARIEGQIDPVNLLLIADVPQVVDRDGRFQVTVAMPPNRRISAVVITPLGNRQSYELAVPAL